tara:strand:- start:828 stop:986 length:159 start_codon:yes stop_codon:yes gene_type:complete
MLALGLRLVRVVSLVTQKKYNYFSTFTGMPHLSQSTVSAAAETLRSMELKQN